MTSKELKSLEGKRITFCFPTDGIYAKYEGKVNIEEIRVTVIKDEQVTKQPRFNLILTDCMVNNICSPTNQRFSFKKVREIKEFKIINYDR